MRYVSLDRSFTQEEVDALSRLAAQGLSDLGVGDGDAVGLLMLNEVEFLVFDAAVGLLGAHPVPIPWHSSSQELAYVAGDAGLRALVAHDVLLDTVAEGVDPSLPVVVVPLPAPTAAALGRPAAPPPAATTVASTSSWADWSRSGRAWDGPARPPRPAVIYTSGTTGRPKGVLRETHTSDGARTAQAASTHRVWGVEPGMRTLLVAPLYHSAPLAYVRAAVTVAGDGGELHFMPRFDAEALLGTVQDAGISHLWMVPTMFVRLLQLPAQVRAGYDTSSLRNVVHSGAPCPVAVKLQMIDWLGPVVNEFYGTTEIGPVTYATSADYRARPGTVGRALPACTVAVLGPDGQQAPPGTEGEVAAVNTTYARFTYRHRPAERDEVEASGLVLTGDVGVLDEDGYLFLRDRKKDMVISGGVNLYPAEVEDVLLQLDNVADGAAFGLPDEVFGESMVAAVTLRDPEPGAVARLERELRQRLSPVKVPRRIYVLQDLPRSDAGKIAKAKLRELVV